MTETTRSALKALALGAFIGAAWLYSIWPALSHDFYEIQCCSGRDCSPLPEGFVTPTPEGWKIQSNGETVPYDDYRVKVSPDGKFHGCFPAANQALRMLCLYVPPQGV